MDPKKLDVYRLIAYFVVAALLFPGPQIVVVAAVITGHLLGAAVLIFLWAMLLCVLIVVSSKTQRTSGSVDSPIVTSEHLLIVKSSPGKPQEIREARTRKLH